MRTSMNEITLAEAAYHASSPDVAEKGTPDSGSHEDEKAGITSKGGLTEADLADQTLYLPAARVRVIAVSVGITFFLAILEQVLLSRMQTILATAVPSIASDFEAGRLSSWVVTSFLLGSTAVAPFFGRLSDIFGRRQTMLTCSAIFFFSTLACAFASSIVQLIMFRTIQGVGTTGIFVLAFIVLTDVVPLTDRGKYQGIVETIVVIGQTAGPLLSGVLVERLSWRACFWILLPVIALTAILQWWLIPKRATNGDWRTKVKSIDYFGSILSLTATLMLLVAVSRGGVEVPWTSPSTIALLASAAVTYIAFGFWEVRGATLPPILPLRLFTTPTVLGVHLATVASLAGHFSIIFYLPNYLQVVRGLSVLVSGAVIFPYGALLSSFVYVSTVLSKRVSTRSLVITGHAIWAAAAGVMTTFSSETSVSIFIGVLVFGAVSGGLCVVTALMALESAAPRADRAVVTSSRNFAYLLGASIGVAISGSIVTNNLSVRLKKLNLDQSTIDKILDDPNSLQSLFKAQFDDVTYAAIVESYVESYRLLFWAVTGMMLFAFAAAAALVRYHPLKREDDEEQKEAALEWLAQEKAKKERDCGNDQAARQV